MQAECKQQASYARHTVEGRQAEEAGGSRQEQGEGSCGLRPGNPCQGRVQEERRAGETMPSRSRFDMPHSHSCETECADSTSGSLGPVARAHASDHARHHSTPSSLRRFHPTIARREDGTAARVRNRLALVRYWPGMCECGKDAYHGLGPPQARPR